MTKYIAHEGERLDQIVYKHYKTLDVFAQVLKLNARLKPILKDKDIVYLPVIKTEQKREIKW